MYVVGTEGDDLLVGGADADTLVGLGGNDTLQGGEGDDLLIGGAGYDTLDGGAGSDTVSYEDAQPVGMFEFLMVNLLGQYASVIGPFGGGLLDSLVSIENVIGSSGADWLVGTAGDNHLSGGAGNDNIEGRGGADVLDGGDGDDAINTVTASSTGPAAAGSMMIGGDGNDTIQSGNSNDTMLGGNGDDFLSVGDFATSRIVDGGAGTDTLSFAGAGVNDFQNGVVFDLNQNAAQTVAPGVVLTVTGVENVYGSRGDDTLVGDGGANSLRGGAGDDTLSGGGGDDFLEGGEGNNVLDGGSGSDTLLYSVTNATSTSVNLAAGVATFVTANGVFTDSLTSIENVIGTNGSDVIVGDANNNFIRGGGGADILQGGAGQDVLDGEAGADTFVFQSGDSDVSAPDTIRFFGGEDRIQFLDGPAGSASNYVELEQPDSTAVNALFAGEGVRYVAMQAGSSVFLYVDLGEEGTTYDQLIVLTGSHVMGMDAGSILGL